jgi:hypothetical protein
MATKNFFPRFFAYYFLKLLLHHFSKKKIHKEVTKQNKESRFFLMLEDLDPEPDSYLVLMDLDAGGKKHTDTTDPDPQN